MVKKFHIDIYLVKSFSRQKIKFEYEFRKEKKTSIHITIISSQSTTVGFKPDEAASSWTNSKWKKDRNLVRGKDAAKALFQRDDQPRNVS